MKQYKYTTYSATALENEFNTSGASGLNNEQIANYQKKFGPNYLQAQQSSILEIFLRQFKSPFIYLLIASAIISYFIEGKTNSILIIIIIAINAGLTFIQEYRAERALALLRQHLGINSRVIRDNKISVINSNELVPGDIVLLQSGDYIPADIRFIEVNNTYVDESILSGESKTVLKTADAQKIEAQNIYGAFNLGFLGTVLTSGNAKALVLSIGAESVFGNISELTLQTTRESGFQLNINTLSKFILKLVIITLVALFLANIILKGGQVDIMQLLLFSISLAIAVTPEALPVVTTFALSQGALRLSKFGVIVKRLSAIEDLGSITILCTDKTGTLTQNILAVHETYKFGNQDPIELAILAAHDENEKNLDPFDLALLKLSKKKEQNKIEKIKEIPFDPMRRRNTVLLKFDGQTILILRGAYEELMKRSNSLTSSEAKDLENWILNEGAKGNRVVAIAYKNLNTFDQDIEKEEKELNFAGLLSFSDPLKPGAKDAIIRAKNLGVTIKMLTGDSREVACAVAKDIGLSDSDFVLTGAEFEKLNYDKKHELANKCNVFARILPAQKYEIINILKENNTVGFLGEGINDAPALKTAHVAIAVKDGTDIAKDASDIVLLKKSLSSIIEGIATGREIFANTFKYIKTVIAGNMGNFYTIAVASLFIDFLPMLPLQILLVNLLCDLPMIAIATDNIDTSEIKKPQKYNYKDLVVSCTMFAIIGSIFDFAFFSIFYKSAPQILQTNWFIENILSGIIIIFCLRTKLPFWSAARPSYILIVLSVLACTIAMILPYTNFGQTVFELAKPALIRVPLIIVFVILYFSAMEIAKILYYKRLNHAK